MKNKGNKLDVLHYGSYCKIGGVQRDVERVSVLNKQHLSSVLYNSAIVLVLAVCGMAAAGLSLSFSIEIGIAAEAVLMLVLLYLALTTNVFEDDNRS
ncbi:MAG: hypothetical protein HKK66_11840 [Chlorobiaceae bacterium]|nr:hypothetical protein [Chlorobiaceae bacterium]